MKSLFGNSKGFTLIELMVVMTIMSVLAAIVVPQVTGTVTTGRGTAKTGDVSTVTQSMQRYNADTGKYPVAAGTSSAAGALPTSGEGSKPIDWNASGTSGGKTVYFSMGTASTKNSGGYVQSNVRHATETRSAPSATVGTSTTLGTGTLTDGDLLSPNLTDPTGGHAKWANADDATNTVYPVWRIDSTGVVFVDLASSDY